MKFGYKFHGRWTVDFCIEINSQRLSSNVTYVTDSLRDLLTALLRINPNCVPTEEVLSSDGCQWCTEPFMITWSITKRSNGMVHVVVKYEDLDDEDFIDTECPYDSLLEAIIMEVDTLIKENGIVGYKENWDYEFPLTTFLKLKNYLLNKNTYPLKEDEYSGIKVSDLNMEMELLSKYSK
ncbi:hypothetical protein [Paenibacillus gansuensis]|uniref:Uncharacterized protein n=1 Tax=Paenibacillus gansuensis TaxID=306542 RepID=A0ABW5PI89_9BACL